MIDFTFRAPLWLWKEGATWHFITVPEEPSAAIKSFAPEAKRGFGSVRVSVTIGSSTRRTSVFPSKETGGYVLPIKKAVRTAEGISVGEDADITLELLM
jgi:hypothetical protein